MLVLFVHTHIVGMCLEKPDKFSLLLHIVLKSNGMCESYMKYRYCK